MQRITAGFYLTTLSITDKFSLFKKLPEATSQSDPQISAWQIWRNNSRAACKKTSSIYTYQFPLTLAQASGQIVDEGRF